MFLDIHVSACVCASRVHPAAGPHQHVPLQRPRGGGQAAAGGRRGHEPVAPVAAVLVRHRPGRQLREPQRHALVSVLFYSENIRCSNFVCLRRG